MELMKSIAIILFILICLAKLQTLVRLSKNERGTESNVLKGNGTIFFFNEKNDIGRLLGILCLLSIIICLVLIFVH
ncbi:TPA: hypothetical protein ACGOYK_000671 [Streptococcus suis]